MNVRTLTPREKNRLFILIAYGRGTPANLARAFDIDRRTAQRLTRYEALAAIIPKPTTLDIGTWYALLDPNNHSWTGIDNIFHLEAQTARAVRDDLASLVKETVGNDLKKRMIEECPKIYNGDDGLDQPVEELRRLLDIDFSIPDEIMRFYHYRTQPTFHDAKGDEL